MAVFQKYIFLRDKHAGTGGYVKLFFGERTRVEARITQPIEQPELLLLGTKTIEVPLKKGRNGATFQGELEIANQRLFAAVHTHGQLLLLGESDPPKADWGSVERRIQDKLRRERAREVLQPPKPIQATPYEVHTKTGEIQGPNIKTYAGEWSWRQVTYKDGQGFRYLAGTVEQENTVLAVAVAVPGKFAKTPPTNLRGFCGYLDGYWVLAQDARTGKRLEI